MKKKEISLAMMLCFFTIFATSVRAIDITDCQTLTAGNSYTLTADITRNGNANCFNLANNTILDLNGHTVTLTSSAGQAYSFMYGSGAFKNITVKNGIVSSSGTFGFISSGSADDVKVQDITATTTNPSTATIYWWYTEGKLNITASSITSSQWDAIWLGDANYTYTNCTSFSSAVDRYDIYSYSSHHGRINGVFDNAKILDSSGSNNTYTYINCYDYITWTLDLSCSNSSYINGTAVYCIIPDHYLPSHCHNIDVSMYNSMNTSTCESYPNMRSLEQYLDGTHGTYQLWSDYCNTTALTEANITSPYLVAGDNLGSYAICSPQTDQYVSTCSGNLHATCQLDAPELVFMDDMTTLNTSYYTVTNYANRIDNDGGLDMNVTITSANTTMLKLQYNGSEESDVYDSITVEIGAYDSYWFKVMINPQIYGFDTAKLPITAFFNITAAGAYGSNATAVYNVSIYALGPNGTYNVTESISQNITAPFLQKTMNMLISSKGVVLLLITILSAALSLTLGEDFAFYVISFLIFFSGLLGIIPSWIGITLPLAALAIAVLKSGKGGG